ncbi:MAG: outer membrane protein transport protein [Bacteroidales bacterium]|nr:outer membrane protein transport protein [Bacteroidales bacterium]MCR5714245.1 outer membrane protein transport protein [Bacteroidales bacterium]
MYNRVLSSILLLGMTSVCLAQGSSDLLRLSQRYPTGTARAMSMGGAFGALGADMSVLGQNPAGIGAYRGDELLITPMLSINHTDATLNGETDTDSKVNFPFNGFGFVSTVNLSPSRTKSMTMGMSYARIADFNQDISITSNRATSSILDEFAYSANNPVGNNDWDPLMPSALGRYEGMAFDVYALDTAYFFGANPQTGFPDAMPYFHDMLDVYGQYQTRAISRRGEIQEYNFSLGFNVDDVWYFGGTLGFHDVYFKEYINHFEQRNATQYLKDYRMTDEFIMEGWGVNFKLGAIYRPIPEMRLGLAYHSPTWYDMTSSALTTMKANYYTSPSTSGELNFYTDADSYFDFDMTTPGRFITSWAYIFPNAGIISIDYEFIDYSRSKMKASGDPTYAKEVTQKARDQFVSTGNLRIGGELRVSPVAYLRAGYANIGNPIDSSYSNGKNRNQQILSAGFGFRGDIGFVDFAYQHYFNKEDIWLYNDFNAAAVEARTSSDIDRIAVTLGLHL